MSVVEQYPYCDRNPASGGLDLMPDLPVVLRHQSHSLSRLCLANHLRPGGAAVHSQGRKPLGKRPAHRWLSQPRRGGGEPNHRRPSGAEMRERWHVSLQGFHTWLFTPVPPGRKSNCQTEPSVGLVDSGASIGVLPYSLGVQLGFDWNTEKAKITLAGTLAHVEARGVEYGSVVLVMKRPAPTAEAVRG